MTVKAWVKWVLALLILGLGFGAWKMACGSKKTVKPTFKTVQVTRGPVSVTVKTTGNVQPENRLEVKPSVAGRVEKIRVYEGDYVSRGQVLATLSSNERAALLDAARAKGPEEVAKWEELYKATAILAPMSGQVINRSVEPGQTVGTGDTVVVLSDRLIVNAQVDETDIGRVKSGLQAVLTLDAYPNDPIPAKVGQIRYEAKTVNNVTMYEVYVRPRKVPTFMRSGMTANVEFILNGKSDTLLLPSEAVKSKDGGSIVLLPGEKDERPKRVEVVTGLTDGKNVEIVSGLNEGDQVLIAVFNAATASNSGANPFMPGRMGGNRSSGASSQRSSGGGERPPPP